MDRALNRPLAIAATAFVLGAVIAPARGAIGPAHGGELTLPAPELVSALDPARARTHFEATLANAIYDGLYEVRASGAIEPVLAEGMPIIEGTTATIRLRPGALHHGGRALSARQVVRSLSRLSTTDASWLLAAFATEHGRPAIHDVDERTIRITLARPTIRAEQVLAASSLAILAGGSLQRPLGTGSFRASFDGRGAVELNTFRHAPDGPPWLNRVRFVAPQARDDEVRAFELGQLDGSWWAQSLYGGTPVRPAASANASMGACVLLVPNRARTLRDDGLWGAVAASIDRQRLERVGLVSQRSVGANLPAPELPPAARIPSGQRLRVIVRSSHALEVRLAEALVGLLDERGARVAVERVLPERYDSVVARGDWDLRFALVRAPLPGRGALVGAALAQAGQIDQARRLALVLDDNDAAAAAARAMHVMVLGNERITLHHRADLLGVTFDLRGRLPLADFSFVRATSAEESR